MKLWKRTSSEQQVGGRQNPNWRGGVWPRVSTNPNGAEDARSLRLAWKTNNNDKRSNNNNNNNIFNDRCQDQCWTEASRRSLQHLPGILRASPEPWRTAGGGNEQKGFASLPYYFPHKLVASNPNHHQSANHNFSSLPIATTGFFKEMPERLIIINLILISIAKRCS